MKYFKSLPKPAEKPIHKVYSSIYDSSCPLVRLEDVKSIINNKDLRKVFLNKSTTSQLEELKVLYVIHLLMISDQIEDIEEITHCFEISKIKYLPERKLNQTQMTTHKQFINNDNSHVQYTQSYQNEDEFPQLYYFYLQKVANNYDIYQSAQQKSYPYEDDIQNRRVQYLWLFKVVNLLNFKLASILNSLSTLIHQNYSLPIIAPIATLIFKDCVNEYIFFKAEIIYQMDFYSQFNVKDALTFYELYLQLKSITDRLIIFYNLKDKFIRHEKFPHFEWFKITNLQEKEIENYIQKAKLINSTQFRQSLQVPSQKAAYEHLQKVLQNRDQVKKIKIKQILSPTQNKQNQNIVSTFR